MAGAVAQSVHGSVAAHRLPGGAAPPPDRSEPVDTSWTTEPPRVLPVLRWTARASCRASPSAPRGGAPTEPVGCLLTAVGNRTVPTARSRRAVVRTMNIGRAREAAHRNGLYSSKPAAEQANPWGRALTRARRYRYGRFLRRLAADTMADRVPGLAAEMAFFAVLGIFPGLLIATGLLGILDVLVGADLAAAVQQQVLDALRTVLTDRASPAVTSVENLFERNRSQLITIAALGALVTVSGAFAVVVEALNLAYDTPEQRSWLKRRLLGLVLGVITLAAAVLALAALVVGPLLGTGQDLADLVGLGPSFSTIWNVVRLPAVGAGLVLWTATLFHVAPNRQSRWRSSLPGAALTTVLWIVASLGFHLYLTIAAGANPVIGAFGGGVIIMTWTYLLCLALLLGGEFNALLECRGGRRGLGSGSQATARPSSESCLHPASAIRRGPQGERDPRHEERSGTERPSGIPGSDSGCAPR